MSAIKELYQHYLQSTGVTTDSRNIKKASIFFALKGENFNGNEYAAEALKNGASLAVVDDKTIDGPGFFAVDDALAALQELAAHHRKTLDIPIIGLTGTNGKTSTKELIREVLSVKYNTYATAGNLNNHIGVPLTILGIKSDAGIAIVEMGANHIGEIKELCAIANPTHGIITNIGKAHLEGFGSYEGIIEAKSELYQHLIAMQGDAFVHYNDEMLMDLSSQIPRATYGDDPEADVSGRITGSVPFMGIHWGGHDVMTHLYGDYNFENVMAAICVGKFFLVNETGINKAIASYIPTNNRSQVVKSGSNTIFLDAYNANPSSMEVSIQQFMKQKADKKAVILGDMLELGDASQEEHQKVISAIENKFDTVILVGPEFLVAGSGEGMNIFPDTNEAYRWLEQNPLADTDILIKGSRGIALERLLSVL